MAWVYSDIIRESFGDMVGLISDYSCVVSRLLKNDTVTIPDACQGSDIAGIAAHEFRSGVYDSLVEYGYASVRPCVSAEGVPSRSYTLTEQGRKSLAEQEIELADVVRPLDPRNA